MLPLVSFATANLWEIDSDLKFTITYQPTNKLLNNLSAPVEFPQPLGYTATYLPDITDINLAAFDRLGFNVSSIKNQESYNYFIKLYNYPSSFVVKNSTQPIMQEFLLDQLAESNYIQKFLSNPESVYVKLGYIAPSDTVFSESSPFPSLQVTEGRGFQRQFDAHAPFSSLYIATSNLPQCGELSICANDSTRGLLFMYNEVIALYNNNLTSIPGVNNNYLYFVDAKRSSNKYLTVISLPRSPTVFDNWQSLPMPINPDKVFLSGLALVERNVYINKYNKKIDYTQLQLGSTDFTKQFTRYNTITLELVSVVKQH